MFGTHLLLQIFLLVLHVSAEPENITIDDTSPRFDYRGIQLIERCNTLVSCANEGLDLSKFYNSTLTKASGGSITLNFTGEQVRTDLLQVILISVHQVQPYMYSSL